MTETNEITGATRAPMRKRGKERFEHLLDAAAAVLGEHPDDEISLAQIAAKAGVPLASVYHFFPNRNAALEALAKRYHQRIADFAVAESGLTLEGWQAQFAGRIRRSAAYLNSEPAALRLFMGAGVSAEIRNVDVAGNAVLAARRAAFMRETYDMPAMPDLEQRIATALALIDGIWALSYSAHRCITDAYIDEGILATIAYLRCYLPERLQLRNPRIL
jgi:AcrR family transcriptional regulator